VRSAIRRMMRVRSTTSRSSSASSTTCCTARDRTGFGCHRGHVRFSRPRVRAGTARSTSDRTGTDLLAQAPTRSLRRGPCQVSSRPVDESATRQPRGAGHYWGQAGWENSAIQHPCHYRVVTPAAVFGWRSAREWQRGTCAGGSFSSRALGPRAPGNPRTPRTSPRSSDHSAGQRGSYMGYEGPGAGKREMAQGFQLDHDHLRAHARLLAGSRGYRTLPARPCSTSCAVGAAMPVGRGQQQLPP
jgi:hypothetical protein